MATLRLLHAHHASAWKMAPWSSLDANPLNQFSVDPHNNLMPHKQKLGLCKAMGGLPYLLWIFPAVMLVCAGRLYFCCRSKFPADRHYSMFTLTAMVYMLGYSSHFCRSLPKEKEQGQLDRQ